MEKKAFWAACTAVAMAASLPAATRTWIGGTGTKVWGTASNWKDGAAPGDGDTAYFPDAGTYTFSAAVTLPSNITFNVSSGTVKFTGVVSGAGGVTRSGGSGDVQFTNTGNTYAGPTTVSSKTFRFASLANIGAACSLGKPTTAANATLNFNNVVRLIGNGTYTTDRPIVLGNSEQFFIDGTSKLTVNGPYTGKGYTRGSGTLVINTYLGAESINTCSRTDAGTTQLTCPTNAFTCPVGIADGYFRGPTLAGKGVPCAFGAGSAITMGQDNWATTGTLCYNGTTDATCDRDVTIHGFTNSTATANHHGGRVRNETAGTCLTLAGTLMESRNTKYAQSHATLYLGGVGDGVLTAPLPGRMAFYKEDDGTWTLTGAHTATGLMEVKAGRLNIDGTVPAACDVATKLTVDAGATLGGTGVVHGTAAILAGATLAPGASDRVGALTLDGASVSIADGVNLAFKFGAGTNDVLALGEGAAFGGALTVSVSLLGATTVAPGSYTLMTWGGSSAPTSVTPTAAVPDGTSFALAGNSLVMTMADAQSLTWKGSGAAEAAWDLASAHWLAGGAEAVFAEQDFATFDDTGTSPTVRIDGTVRPSGVTVDADETAYAFTGAGGLAGHMSFTKRGAATLTVNTSNCYTKATAVEEGTYVLNGTLDGSPLAVAHGASFQQGAGGVIAGDDLTLAFGYGNHWLQGTNTFGGDVVWDTRGLTTDNGNVYLHLAGSNALGNASTVTVYGYSGANNHFPNLSLEDDTFIADKTFVAGNTANLRAYIRKPNSAADAGWHGDIVGESGSSAGAQFQINNEGGGALEIGTPGGTNEIRGKVASFNFRGFGPIRCYSRIALDGTVATMRNDAGTVTLYATNSAYATLSVVQGTIRMGAANVIPAGAAVNVGKDADDNSFSTLDLDGFDQTCAGFYESSVTRTKHANRVLTPEGKPATLTANVTADRAWGSSHSWIEGPLTLVKTGAKNLTLNGTNTYTGATLMQAGTLTLNSALALGGTTNVVLTGGTINAKASGALNADGTLTVPDPAAGTLSLADGTEQTVDWLFVNGIAMPSGRYTKAGAGSDARLAFLARGTGGGTLLVRKGSGSVFILR